MKSEYDRTKDLSQEYVGNVAVTRSTESAFVNRVFAWMCFGLLLTGAVAYGVAGSQWMLELLYGNRWVMFLVFGIEILLVIGLTAAINKISPFIALFGYIVFALINGLVLSSIFLVYESGSLAVTFLTTAGMFGAMALWGYTTKRSLTGLGGLFLMGLIGLIIASVVNIFVGSSMLEWIISIVGVLIFTGLTAYDAQKISMMARQTNLDADMIKKGAIMGALTLYLDFINLFLFLLRLMGSRK